MMVLLAHTSVVVRPSKKSGLGSLRNLTSINATNRNANENTILGSVFYAKNFYSMLTYMGLCIKYVRKIFQKTNIFYHESKKYYLFIYFYLFIHVYFSKTIKQYTN